VIQKVHIEEDFPTGGHRVYVLGRPFPGEPRSILRADGNWEKLPEAGHYGPGDTPPTLVLPDGALDALVQAAVGASPPQPATQEALQDTRGVRDRLLGLVERLADPPQPKTELRVRE